MPRRTVASFTARIQTEEPTTETPDDARLPRDTPDDTRSSNSSRVSGSTNTPSTTGSNPDVLMGLLQNFLSERQRQAHPATAFGSYIDGSLQRLPAAIRRTAEARIIGVLHECQNQADQQLFRPIQPQQTVPADGQRPRSGEYSVQYPACRPREPAARQWQPSPSMWPAEVTNPPDLWHSMDRPWVQEQFPEMNINCSPPVTGNQTRTQQPSSNQHQSMPAAEVQTISFSQMLASDSPSLLSQTNINPTSANQE